jgi:arylsulfatase A-like enzyme
MKAIYVSILAAVVFSSGWAAEPKRPNIVLIMADDLGFSDLGCYGGEIQTPKIDRLAAEGLSFTQFYNCAVCNASRAAMLTGIHPRYGGTGYGYMRGNLVTLAEVLRQAGYATTMSGKWHLATAVAGVWQRGGYPNRPIDRGFQDYYGLMIGARNYFDPIKADPAGFSHYGPPEPFVQNETPITSVPSGYYATDAYADYAVKRIHELSQEGRPFFLHLAFTAPHYPLQARPEDIAKYRGKYQDGYGAVRRERYRRLVELGLIAKNWRLPEPDRKLGDWRYDLEPQAWNDVADKGWESAKMEVYAAMVDRLDQAVGRVMAALKERGIDDNTLVIFLSDNGACGSASSAAAYQAYQEGKPVGDKDSYILTGPGWATAQSSPFRRYKTWTYEGGITTPMIVRWPRQIKAGSRTTAVTHLVDLFPTLLEISGTSYPQAFNGQTPTPLEGISLKPLLLDGREPGERELGWFLYGSRAYRKGKWKIVWGVTAKKWELFDMEADRTENFDLAAKHPELVRDLADAWQGWAKRCLIPEAQRS